MPDTIAGRTIAVLVIGLVGLHLASIWAYQNGLNSGIDLTNAARTAERLVAIKSTLEKLPQDKREATAHTLSGGALDVHFSLVPLAIASKAIPVDLKELRAELSTRLPPQSAIRLIVGSPQTGSEHQTDPHLTLVSVPLSDGSWVNTNIALLEGPHSTWQAVIISTALMGLGVVGIALAMAGSVTKPIRNCAADANRVYAAEEPQPIPVTGPREVRELAIAFNDMQHRVKKLVDERTLMLAAISHDLKSPISRMRLRVEALADETERRDLEADIDELLQMIDASLQFLKGDQTLEPAQRLDLGAIVGTICGDLADQGCDVRIEFSGKAILRGRRLALKRAFANIIENAVKYGNAARVGISIKSNNILVTVEDDGPGIPEDQLDLVFRPFYRVESSRSRDTGGVGLGLTIARSAIQAHGGRLSISNRQGGGLTVEVALPSNPSLAQSPASLTSS